MSWTFSENVWRAILADSGPTSSLLTRSLKKSWTRGQFVQPLSPRLSQMLPDPSTAMARSMTGLVQPATQEGVHHWRVWQYKPDITFSGLPITLTCLSHILAPPLLLFSYTCGKHYIVKGKASDWWGAENQSPIINVSHPSFRKLVGLLASAPRQIKLWNNRKQKSGMACG